MHLLHTVEGATIATTRSGRGKTNANADGIQSAAIDLTAQSGATRIHRFDSPGSGVSCDAVSVNFSGTIPAGWTVYKVEAEASVEDANPDTV